MPDHPGARLLGRGDMSDGLETPRWYRSLYWRAAIAFFALFALLLAAEAALFLWFSAGMAGAMPESRLQTHRDRSGPAAGPRRQRGRRAHLQ